MEKKNVKKVKSSAKKLKIKTTEQSELKSFLVVVLVVIGCVLGLYIVTVAFVAPKETEKTKEEVAGEVNYDVAIMGQLLNRPYDEYYAVVYDTNGDYMYEMSALVAAYNAKDKHKHMYTIDLGNKLNESYYNPEKASTKPVKKLEDLKVGDVTLIKVKKGKISKIITDMEKMKKELDVK